jgi:hypothetical protein
MISGSSLTFSSSVPRPALPVHAQRVELVAELLEHRRQPGLHRMAEDDRVGDLHHRRLHVQRKQDALGLGLLDLLGEERLSAARS